MPHIKIECSEKINFNSEALLGKLHQAIAGEASINLKDIKSRVIYYKDFLIGDGSSKEFVHCELALLTGRTEEQRKELSDKLFSVLRAEFNHGSDSELSFISVEVREMERGSYKKL